MSNAVILPKRGPPCLFLLMYINWYINLICRLASPSWPQNRRIQETTHAHNTQKTHCLVVRGLPSNGDQSLISNKNHPYLWHSFDFFLLLHATPHGACQGQRRLCDQQALIRTWHTYTNLEKDHAGCDNVSVPAIKADKKFGKPRQVLFKTGCDA